MAPGGKTYARLKNNRTGMGTDTALFQQPAPQKLTTTRKSAKGNAAAPSSSSSVSVRIPPRRVRSHRDVAAQQPQQRKLEKRKKAAAPQLNENCPGDHRHPSQTLLEQQNNALYRLLFDGSKENYFTHLERARHFVHTCAVCAKKYEFVLVRFPDTGVETPWHPVLPKHENIRHGWTLLDLEMLEPDTIYSFDAAWQDCTAPDEAIGGNENEDGGDDENGRGNNSGGGNKKEGDQRRDGGGGQKDGGGGSKDGERRNKNGEGREEEEQNDNNGKRGEREREEERREEEEEQSGHNEERGEKKRREEGRGKEGGEQERRGEEEDDGRGKEETRERGDEEETEEAREKLKRGEEKERGEKGEKETNGGKVKGRSESGGKAKEGRSEGEGKAGEKKQPQPGSKMTHSQWRRVMRLNKKKGLKEGQDNAHPATIFNLCHIILTLFYGYRRRRRRPHVRFPTNDIPLSPMHRFPPLPPHSIAIRAKTNTQKQDQHHTNERKNEQFKKREEPREAENGLRNLSNSVVFREKPKAFPINDKGKMDGLATKSRNMDKPIYALASIPEEEEEDEYFEDCYYQTTWV
ncbi:hypothetical protein niasHT_036576 [Heterodera trifolii]|uniref:Uncharacterized protein n=1 Tax=Heterodera trifolii TaxID=157864 RepID=A0ABD2I8V2_9BILA